MATASLYTSLSSSSSFCVDGGVDLIRIWDPITAMAGAASALFLLDIKGRVLIWRDYRGDVTAVEAERFFTKLIEKEVHSFFSPIDDYDYSFIYARAAPIIFILFPVLFWTICFCCFFYALLMFMLTVVQLGLRIWIVV